MNLKQAQQHDAMIQLLVPELILLNNTNAGFTQWGNGVFATAKEISSTSLQRISPGLMLNHSYGYMGGNGQGGGYLFTTQFFGSCSPTFMMEASINQ